VAKPRLKDVPGTDWENKFGHPESIVVGVDEVGRGCLAGPVAAAAVVLPSVIDRSANPWLNEVKDSKLLTSSARERLAPLIRQWVRFSAVASASVEEIDSINILRASQLAMVRAIEALGVSRVDHVLIDGNRALEGIDSPSTPIVKGDRYCLSIACASVLAKVWRDDFMCDLHVRFSGYDFAVNKGYPTSAHDKALECLGVTSMHRRTFAPVAKRLKKRATGQGDLFGKYS
jgi:ribonuclease HII